MNGRMRLGLIMAVSICFCGTAVAGSHGQAQEKAAKSNSRIASPSKCKTGSQAKQTADFGKETAENAGARANARFAPLVKDKAAVPSHKLAGFDRMTGHGRMDKADHKYNPGFKGKGTSSSHKLADYDWMTGHGRMDKAGHKYDPGFKGKGTSSSHKLADYGWMNGHGRMDKADHKYNPGLKSRGASLSHRIPNPYRYVKVNPKFFDHRGQFGHISAHDGFKNHRGGNHGPSYPDFNVWRHRPVFWGHNGICRPAFDSWCQRECGDTSPSCPGGSKRWGSRCTPGKVRLCDSCGFLD